MAAYKGNVYVAGSFVRDHAFKSGIWKYDANNLEQPGKLVLEINDKWQMNPQNQGIGCMQISYYDGMLYYNTPTEVWRWNFDENTKPEKVFSLAENIVGQIWYLHVADGKIYYETGVYEKSDKVSREYVIDNNYKKAAHPIAVTSDVMTLKLEESSKETYLQAAAPGKVTFKANNSDICDLEVAYEDRSCKLIPKKSLQGNDYSICR